MDNQNVNFTPANDKGESNNKALWKGAIISIFVLALLLPISYIKDLIAERAGRQAEVTEEVSKKWSNPQTLTGPLLAIPYYERVKKEGKEHTQKSIAYFLPDDLQIDGAIQPEIRNRALYKVGLMKSELLMKGTFKPINLTALELNSEDMLWGEAKLILGLTDIKGLSKDVQLSWGTQALMMRSGIPQNNFANNGVSIPVSVNAGSETGFNIKLSLKSSKYIYFNALGNNTDIHLKSSWTAPSFEGMPDTTEIDKTGFNAHWKLVQASRGYPQQWKNNSVNLSGYALGVRFANADENYIMTERIVKYAILFIALTFAIFFLIEMLQKLQIHPLQYGLVGIALCIFYILVLSISEYAGFNTAYAIASSATVALIGMYVWSIFRKTSVSLAFTFGLAILYAYIFFLIQLEEMSLIFGSVALFLVVAAIMFFTRKVNWYNLGKRVA
ncbi:cell envelope integrity protein CreD [Taibaiella sp. KBW10]|uniref:cell envelope integrity protein CreD n=1 Tax=Taibaiella sp. KBW10 TaxID=2153357 RepID=UPI000F59B3D8|nr:cell envelope integrity protein CreD [Taibaiella sp. KBW10]RQO30576.1 cell envelope integrity protein CreD [Taibaiella sp. KBW10]